MRTTMDDPPTYPRWIHGGPNDRTVVVTLRDVGEGVYVGSFGADTRPEVADAPVVLVQCQAGLSRSASVGYALLRSRGVAHAEALRRVSLRIEHASYVEAWPRRVTLESCVAWATARYGR